MFLKSRILSSCGIVPQWGSTVGADASFQLLHFDSRPSSCCLCKTIILLMMCEVEVCPLLLILLNDRLSVRGGGERWDAIDIGAKQEHLGVSRA